MLGAIEIFYFIILLIQIILTLSNIKSKSNIEKYILIVFSIKLLVPRFICCMIMLKWMSLDNY